MAGRVVLFPGVTAPSTKPPRVTPLARKVMELERSMPHVARMIEDRIDDVLDRRRISAKEAG